MLAQLAQHQRTHAQRVAHTDQLGPRHRDDREGAFHAAQRIGDPVGMLALDRARHQVDDAFAVRAGLEDRAAFDQLAAQRVGIGQVAVMGDRAAAHRELAEEGLDVADHRTFGAGGGVTNMADGDIARQRFHQARLGEVVADIAETVGRVEAGGGVMGDDAARFLTAVLEGVKTEGHEIRGVGNADNTEDAAFFLELVVVERVGVVGLLGGGAGHGISSE